MRLLVLHLSDIHITNTTDVVLDRTEHIISAIQNIDYELDYCIIALTGDIVYAGTEEQYLVAMEFIDSIKIRLQENLRSGRSGASVPVQIVAVPGNHDCHLPSEQPDGARISVLDSLLRDHKNVTDLSIQELCLRSQDNYFNFLSAMTDFREARANSDFNKKISYRYEFLVNGESICIYCCNTAWMSRRKEAQGALFLPADVLPDKKERHALALTLYHHPLNWHEANEARGFMKRATSISDIVLTGHEHDVTRRSQEGDRGEIFAHIEGGALQDSSDSSTSTFNVFVIDTISRKQKFASMAWDGSKYVLDKYKAGQDGAGLAWEDFFVNRLRLSSSFELVDSMKSFLNEPGVLLNHHEKGALTLNHIFLPPDLREINLTSTVSPRIVHGINILQLVEQCPHLLITGDSQSGKTCLGKMIFQRMMQDGFVPIWMSADDRIPPSGDRVFGFFEDLFLKQYSGNDLTLYRQLDRAKRVIIVDDYDKIKLASGAKRRFVERATHFADNVILLSHDLAQGIDDIFHPSARVFFDRFKIQPFGHQQRDAFLQQWFSLSTREERESQELAHKLNEVTKTVNTVVGTNFVPAYPIYLLSILQAAEAATPVNAAAGTHGYFYEVLIKASLLKGRSAREYDILSAYLARLAFLVFESTKKQFNEEDFRRFHSIYQERHDSTRPYEQMRSQLLSLGIIIQHFGDVYEFRYTYVYYYFVATYIKDHIGKSDIKAHISRLAKLIYRTENANILLFVAHLSRDEFLISELIRVAESHYENCPAAQIEQDVAFLNDLQQLAESIVFEDQGVLASRKQRMQELDQAEEQQKLTEAQIDQIDEARAAIDPLVRLNSALKTMQIMGQLLKNFPGHLEVEEKLSLTKQCYAIGLRALSSIFTLLRDNQTNIVNDIINLIRERHPEFKEESTRRMAQKTVVSLGRLSAFGIIKRISLSVGSSELTRTYEKLIKEMPQASVELINISLALDHAGQFPISSVERLSEDFADNQLAYWLLQCLVVNHFHLFPVPLTIKQRICKLLDVQYKPAKFFDEREKILRLGSRN